MPLSEQRARELALLEPPRSLDRIVRFLEELALRLPTLLPEQGAVPSARTITPAIGSVGLAAAQMGRQAVENAARIGNGIGDHWLPHMMRRYQIEVADIQAFSMWLVRWNDKRAETESIRDPREWASRPVRERVALDTPDMPTVRRRIPVRGTLAGAAGTAGIFMAEEAQAQALPIAPRITRRTERRTSVQGDVSRDEDVTVTQSDAQEISVSQSEHRRRIRRDATTPEQRARQREARRLRTAAEDGDANEVGPEEETAPEREPDALTRAWRGGRDPKGSVQVAQGRRTIRYAPEAPVQSGSSIMPGVSPADEVVAAQAPRTLVQTLNRAVWASNLHGMGVLGGFLRGRQVAYAGATLSPAQMAPGLTHALMGGGMAERDPATLGMALGRPAIPTVSWLGVAPPAPSPASWQAWGPMPRQDASPSILSPYRHTFGSPGGAGRGGNGFPRQPQPIEAAIDGEMSLLAGVGYTRPVLPGVSTALAMGRESAAPGLFNARGAGSSALLTYYGPESAANTDGNWGASPSATLNVPPMSLPGLPGDISRNSGQAVPGQTAGAAGLALGTRLLIAHSNGNRNVSGRTGVAAPEQTVSAIYGSPVRVPSRSGSIAAFGQTASTRGREPFAGLSKNGRTTALGLSTLALLPGAPNANPEAANVPFGSGTILSAGNTGRFADGTTVQYDAPLTGRETGSKIRPGKAPELAGDAQQGLSDEALRPELGQMTLVAPPMRVASEQAEQSGVATDFDWQTLVRGAGALDAGGLARLKAVLPPSAHLIYPALPPGSLSGGSVNLALAPSLLREVLARGYSGENASQASRWTGLAAGVRGGSPMAQPLAARLVPHKAPARASAGLLGDAEATGRGALDQAGGGQARRGGALDFLGMPVRLAPSLGGKGELAQEVAARGGSGQAANPEPVRPQTFASLRDRLFPAFQSVQAEPDERAWQKAAPQFGLRDSKPTTLLAPDSRIQPPTAAAPLPATSKTAALLGSVAPGTASEAAHRPLSPLLASLAGGFPGSPGGHTGSGGTPSGGGINVPFGAGGRASLPSIGGGAPLPAFGGHGHAAQTPASPGTNLLPGQTAAGTATALPFTAPTLPVVPSSPLSGSLATPGSVALPGHSGPVAPAAPRLTLPAPVGMAPETASVSSRGALPASPSLLRNGWGGMLPPASSSIPAPTPGRSGAIGNAIPLASPGTAIGRTQGTGQALPGTASVPSRQTASPSLPFVGTRSRSANTGAGLSPGLAAMLPAHSPARSLMPEMSGLSGSPGPTHGGTFSRPASTLPPATPGTNRVSTYSGLPVAGAAPIPSLSALPAFAGGHGLPTPARTTSRAALPTILSLPSAGSSASPMTSTSVLSSRAPQMPMPSRRGGADGSRRAVAEPMTIQRYTTTAQSAKESQSASGAANGQRAGQHPGKNNAANDVQLLANEVWTLLKRRLTTESERRGRW